MLTRLFLVIGVGLQAIHTQAAPIGPGDINPGSTLLTFDSYINGTLLSDEFAALGVILGSGQPPVVLVDGTPAPYVATEAEFPNATASPPNKIIGTLTISGGSPQKCNPCAIVLTFLDPLPTQVAFWVSDPDSGQYAEFSGPTGSLDTLTVDSGSSAVPFFMGLQDASGISQVVIHSVATLGVGIDNLQFGTPVPEPSTGLLLAFGLVGLKAVRRQLH